nr:hypothetical protein [uncultured Dyadobacter sp.]
MKHIARPTGLNDIQISLLRMFNRNIPDEDVMEIKRVLVKHLSGRLLAEVDMTVAKKGISETDYKNLESADIRTKPGTHDK